MHTLLCTYIRPITIVKDFISVFITLQLYDNTWDWLKIYFRQSSQKLIFHNLSRMCNPNFYVLLEFETSFFQKRCRPA